MAVILALFSTIIIISSISFVRSKDAFIMVQIVKITNYYILPLFLSLILYLNFSYIAAIKLVIIFILNIITTNVILFKMVKEILDKKVITDSK